MVKIEKATAEHVKKYFNGKLPAFSLRGVAAVDGERVLGIGGIYRAGHQFMLFIDMDEEMKKHKRALIEASRLVLHEINRYTMVTAIVNPEDTKAVAFAERFGFVDSETTTEYGKVMVRWSR
jgi:hypothetical protein